jgi:AbrB family looped-hinge helix DNA binding protein
MVALQTKVTEGGRVVIPAEFRRQLGLQVGSDVILDIADGELRIRSVQQAIQRAQSLVRRHVRPTASLADELIRERHEAAERE